jgi:uncharacterized protein YrrD
MDIKLNAPVECLGRERGGKISGVIVNPRTDELTHLVVNTDGVKRIIPAVLITDATGEIVQLGCTVASLHQQPPFIETEYIRSKVEQYDYFPWGEVQVRYVPKTFVVKHDHIPDGEAEIKRGMAVFARDGRVGQVRDVVVNPVNNQITHIIIREGHLWDAKEVVVGVEHIKAIEDDGIHLKTTKPWFQHVQLISHLDNPVSNPGSDVLDIPVHATVHCTDGDFGHSTCLIINPVNDEITHFVVNDRRFMGVEHIVPVSFINSTTEDSITVNCDRVTLAQQPNFIEYEYDRGDEPLPFREEHIYWPMMIPDDTVMYTSPYLPTEHEQIPAGELAVRRGMTVYAAAENEDGEKTDRVYIGRVEAFMANPKTGHITHLILREGRLWGTRDITIPARAMSKIEAENVQLNLTKLEIEALPSIPVQHWMSFAQREAKNI